MKLALHSLACALGATIPPILFDANLLLCFINMAVIIAACLTFENCVHGKSSVVTRPHGETP